MGMHSSRVENQIAELRRRGQGRSGGSARAGAGITAAAATARRCDEQDGKTVSKRTHAQMT